MKKYEKNVVDLNFQTYLASRQIINQSIPL